jgi:hypothetical protein
MYFSSGGFMAKTALKKTDSGEPKSKRASKTAGKTKKKAKKVTAAAPNDVGLAARACKIKGCKRVYRAKGYCRAHYKKWRQGEYGKKRFKPCKDQSCFKPMAMNRHGFCEDHFQNYYVKGIAQAKAPAPEKPAAKKEETPAAEAS